MIDLAQVQNLVASWWFDYDQGNFEAWPRYFSLDAHFACRSDKGDTEFEEFFRVDTTGRDNVLAWNVEHRRNSPYPLRHNGTNVHITDNRGSEADFRSYLLCTHIVDMAVSPLASGVVLGTVREEDAEVCFADLRVILDFTNSEVYSSAKRYALV